MLDRLLTLLRTARTSGTTSDGAVSKSVATSLRRAMLQALVAWNLLLAGVVAVSDPRVEPALLVPAHLLLAGIALAASRDLVRLDVCLVLGYCLWLVDYLAAQSPDDAVTLAACWLGNLLYLASALALQNRARTWLPVAGSCLVVAVLITVDPIWKLEQASAFVVTAIAVVVAARFAMPALWGLAETADAHARVLDSERRLHELLRRTGADAAEDARLIHDTVINTLGAIANIGPSTRPDAELEVDHLAAVRERCLSDLGVIENLLVGRRRPRHLRLTEIGHGTGPVRVLRTGLVGAELDGLADILPTDTVVALVGAANEAIRNAGKHAGVDAVTVDVRRTGSDVVVSVLDDGTGFDLRSPVGHGVEESVRGRIRAVGGEVLIDSAPGRGTRLTISCPLHGAGAVAEPATDLETDVASISTRLTRRACWLASTGVLGVGVVIEAVNRPGEPTWTYAMLVLVGGCTVLSAWAARRWPVLPGPVAAVLALALPVGFVATMAGIDFGRTEVLTYQAIGIAPLLVVLLTVGTPRWALVGGSLLIGTAAVLAAWMWTESPQYGAIVVVGVAPAIGLGAGWWSFQQLVVRIVSESEQARRLAFAAALDLAARSEIAEARLRWGNVSLERSADLLRGVGHGNLDATHPAVQGSCAAEERYLRQLLLLSPSAYRMSVWFARALAAARSRDLELTIRSGDLDAPDSGSAAAIGELLLEAVTDTPEGSVVTVSWFPTSTGIRLSIVGPPARPRRAPLPESWKVERSTFGDREMVEIVVPEPAATLAGG